MQRIASILTAILLAGALAAQEKPADNKAAQAQEKPEAVIIPVKTLSGDSFERLVKLLQVFGARFTADDHLRTIIVYAPADVVTQMKRVVAELDRPGSEAAIGRNIEMTLTFLRCSVNKASTPSTLPPDIESAARQLRAATQYKDIEIWDTVPLHLQEGKETSESMLLPRLVPNLPAPSAQLLIRPDAVGKRDSGRYVRFARLEIAIKLPTAVSSPASLSVVPNYSFQNLSLNTPGDYFEGQKTVLGKISGIDDETAIFVVIALKVLD